MRTLYRLVGLRRDIRHFRPGAVPDDLLVRLLWAAHQAGSVGFMQPWSFVVVRDPKRRRALRDTAERQRLASAAAMSADRARASDFLRLKVEGIVECGVVLVVTVDPTRGGHHVLGRYSDLESDVHSACCAIENLWLAARAEGVGMGWVSFFHPGEVQEALGIPPHIRPLAILCLGWPEAFPARPLLEAVGWEHRRTLADLVHVERWSENGPPGLHGLPTVHVAVAPPDAGAMRLARQRQDRLTRPPGSVGILEDLSVRLAGMAGRSSMPEPNDRSVASTGPAGPAPDLRPLRVEEADHAFEAEARAWQAHLTKPAGSLGQLEDLSVRLDSGGVDRRRGWSPARRRETRRPASAADRHLVRSSGRCAGRGGAVPAAGCRT